MSKIKSVSTYDGSSWGTAVPLGADDVNVDITSATTNPTDSTNTVASLSTADVTVASGDDNAAAWTKFNRFRKRVANNFGRYIAGSIQTSYNATGSSTTVYPTSVINNYMQNVIGLTGTSTPTINGSAQTVASALSSLNDKMQTGHVYFAPTELGLTGTPTMKTIVDTMPVRSIGCFGNAQIDQSGLLQPLAGDINVIIIFKNNAYRTFALGARSYHDVIAKSTGIAFAFFDESQWIGWYDLDQTSHYYPNETFSPSTSLTLSGFITNNTTQFITDIYLPKSIAFTTVSVTNFTGQIRTSSGGYLDNSTTNQSFLSSPYSITPSKVNDHIVRIKIDKSSAFTNVSNNTPAIFFGTVALKFT